MWVLGGELITELNTRPCAQKGASGESSGQSDQGRRSHSPSRRLRGTAVVFRVHLPKAFRDFSIHHRAKRGPNHPRISPTWLQFERFDRVPMHPAPGLALPIVPCQVAFLPEQPLRAVAPDRGLATSFQLPDRQSGRICKCQNHCRCR
jgi:hypothetical protein